MNNENIKSYLTVVQPRAEINFNIRRRNLQSIIPYGIGTMKEKNALVPLKVELVQLQMNCSNIIN